MKFKVKREHVTMHPRACHYASKLPRHLPRLDFDSAKQVHLTPETQKLLFLVLAPFLAGVDRRMRGPPQGLRYIEFPN